jgi:alpha-glucosidase
VHFIFAFGLAWIREAAAKDMLVSLAMPNCFNHAVTELKYVDMIRIDDDCYEGDWNFVSDRKRGVKKDDWPQFGNAFDGFVAFADIRGKGKMILDGDFMRMHKLKSDDERRFLFSLMVMGGSALTIADQYNTIGGNGWVYQNTELNSLNDSGFIARPLSNDYKDSNSSRWIGQTPSGSWIVGLFNRETTPQIRTIDLQKELGMKGGRAGNIRDLWLHNDLGTFSGIYSVTLRPHECRILRIE